MKLTIDQLMKLSAKADFYKSECLSPTSFCRALDADLLTILGISLEDDDNFYYAEKNKQMVVLLGVLGFEIDPSWGIGAKSQEDYKAYADRCNNRDKGVNLIYAYIVDEAGRAGILDISE